MDHTFSGLSKDPSAVLTCQTFVVFSYVCCIFIAVKFVFSTFIYPFYISPLRHLPGPKKERNWIFGQSLNILRTPWIPRLYQRWGLESRRSPFIRVLKRFNSETLVPNTIAAYRQILQTKNSCFVKPEESRRGAIMMIGDGLPWVHGSLHRQRRAILNKTFSAPNIRAFVPRVKFKAERLVESILRANQKAPDSIVEVETDIWKVVLDMAGIKSMGLDLNHLESNQYPLYDIFNTTMRPTIPEHVIRWLVTHMPLQGILPMERCSGFVRKCGDARRFIREHVEARRKAWVHGNKKVKGVNEGSNALQLMIEQDGLWDNVSIVEYILNLMVLGHDTTACTLVWALDVLSRRSDIQDRLRREVTSMKEFSWGEIDHVRYLDNFLREVLRIYCPVPWIPMGAACDVEVAGVLIPKGTNLNMCPAMMNLKPEIWGPDAAEFNPDRWDSLQGDAAGMYAFASFHYGPRVCIGKALSMMEMKVILVELISRFRFEAIREEPLEVGGLNFTLKPKDLLRVKILNC